MKAVLRLISAVGVSLLILGAGATAAAVENSGVGGKPANPRADNPRSQSIFVYELTPGESVDDAVRVINNTDQPKSVAVYATDAQISSGGAFACEQKADNSDQEGSWVKLSKEIVALAPNGEEVVPFTLTVPKDTSAGEHNACIAIQAIEAPTQSSINGVQLSFRSAIRVAVTVPGDISKQLSYDALSAKVKDKKIIVNQQLKNNGNVSLDTKVETKLKTLFGNSLQSITGEYPMLAQQRTELNFEFDTISWGGLYRVASSATYNSDTSASLGQSGGSTGSVAKSTFVFIIPAPLPLLLYLLILAAIGYAVYRKRQYRQMHQASEDYVVKAGDNLQSIAAAHSLSWKLLARINKLKAPYILEKGQTLKIPVVKTPAAKPKKSGETETASEPVVSTSAEKEDVKPAVITKKATSQKKSTKKKPSEKQAVKKNTPKKPAAKKKATKPNNKK